MWLGATWFSDWLQWVPKTHGEQNQNEIVSTNTQHDESTIGISIQIEFNIPT